MLVTGFLWGPQAAFGYNGFFSSLGILPIFILVNILLVKFMWQRHRDEFSWWRHGLLPILGAATFTAALWFSVVPLPRRRSCTSRPSSSPGLLSAWSSWS